MNPASVSPSGIRTNIERMPIRSHDIPVVLPMKSQSTEREVLQKWLRRPAAGRPGGVSPPVFSSKQPPG